MIANPLLIDPTRTIMLRKRFSAEMARRFAKFSRELHSLIAVEDAFRLSRVANEPFTEIPDSLTSLDDYGLRVNGRWAYLTTPEQLENFQRWLENQIAIDIIQKSTITGISASWLNKYIREAYLKGQARGFDETVKSPLWTGISPRTSAMGVYQGAKLQFMTSPVSMDRLQLLMTRTQSELTGVTAAMSQQLSRELLDSMVRDLNPKDIARNVLDRVDKVGKTRALAIAQSEVIRAHSEGVLDAMEALGVDEVGVMVEWQTGSNPCKVCQSLRGVVMPIAKARGLFPRHPRCMCTPVPANVGENHREQIRGKRKVQAAIHRSIRAEYPKRSLSKAKAKSRWAKSI